MRSRRRRRGRARKPDGFWTAAGCMCVDASYKSGPLVIVPLAAALERARRGDAGPLAVGLDASVPYRILIEVLFTAGQARYHPFHLLARMATGFGAIVLVPPEVRPDHVVVDPGRLQLAVFITSDGLSVMTSGGSIAPGCAAFGPGLTFPHGPSGLDLAGLRACAAWLRARDPQFAGDTQAVLVAKPDVPFGEVVAVMDTLRAEPSGRVGVPDVQFGVAR